MRIVHLATDTKIAPLARSLFEEAFPGRNRWLIERPPRAAIRHVAAAPDVLRLGASPIRFGRIARELRGADLVVVHNITPTYARSLRAVHDDRLVFWMSGGAEYMQLLEARLGGMLLPRTAELLRSLPLPPAKAPGLWKRLRSRWRPQGLHSEPPPLLAVVQRIDAFSVNPVDARMLRELLPSLRARLHTIPSYTVEDVFSAGPAAMSGPDVLLGNSAKPSSNHLEAIDLLRGRLPEGGRIVCPLSYGKTRAGYVRAVIDAGRAAFGERFEPLTEWMPIEAYNSRIARCGVVLMNHRRQEAMGNICAALYRGATVYMRRDGPLWGFFADLGIVLNAIETLEANPRAPLQRLTPDQQQRNRQAVVARYGREHVVARIRALADFGRQRMAA
jgi:hypothetical protein